MRFSSLSIDKKIRLGFAILLGLLVGIGAIGYYGISRMKTNASLVIDGNKLDAILAQNEVDHLNWANAVNAFLTDPTVVDLEAVNEHDCNLGLWLKSQDRQKYEDDIASIIPLIKALEEPHAKLHQSSIKIKKIFKHVDPTLLGVLNESESDHLKWASQIREAFLQEKESLEVETNSNNCSLGRWLTSSAGQKAYNNGNTEFKTAWDQLVSAHKKLHETTIDIQKHIAFKQAETAINARKTIMTKLEENANELSMTLDDLVLDVVRPSLEKAEADGNVSELLTWSTVEENINQVLVRYLLDMQRNISQYETDKTQAVWNIYESKLPRFNDGLKRVLMVLGLSEDLVPITNKISKLSTQYLTDAQTYKQKMDIGLQAKASSQKAQDIFKNQTMPLLEDMINQLGVMKAQVQNDLEDVTDAKNIYAVETLPALQKVQSGLNAIRTQAKESIMTDQTLLESVKSTQKTVTIVSAIALIIGILLGIFMPRGIVKVLTGISKEMDDSANQVASAAEQMSASSQSLAEGTADQAEAMSETSSSLETMSAKTQQNEANVREADNLMKDANVIVNEADDAMDELSSSIKEISIASEETQHIIKTIDEIAFQTNLLALNAAVEAARAGEAGAGFSVVADEVRNLAIRAAEAAKNTSELIEGTVRRVKDGAVIVDKTNDAMTKVSQSALKIGELLSEIAIASQDNTSKIAEINNHISEADTITQQNASSAEESASAAEEMSAQAEQMKELVNTLRTMVGGKADETEKQTVTPPLEESPFLEAPEQQITYHS